jgi:hypothetical protein
LPDQSIKDNFKPTKPCKTMKKLKMMQLLKNLLLLLMLAPLLFTACTDKNEDPEPIATLTAQAGVDQNVKTGETVRLDGSASTSSTPAPFTYAWHFARKPAGSNAALTDANTARPTFIADLAGEYELELTINSQAVSSKDKVLVTATADQMPLVLEDITVNTVLEDRFADANLPDYLVNKTIAVSAQLTVKPGVVIAFAQDALLDVRETGVLIASGEATKKVRFTGKGAQQGYWAGIRIYSNSSANLFSHAEILYAGSTPIVSGVKAGVLVTDAGRLTVHNTTISRSGGYGLYLSDGSVPTGFALNAFSHNAQAPVSLMANHVPVLDVASQFTGGNGVNAIEVRRSDITGTGEAVWPAFQDGTPYRFTGLVIVQGGWKLSPGLTIEVVEDEYIEIADGYLNAVGTAEKKITFTGVVKTRGSWNGMILYPRSSFNQMEHVEISYGGGNELISGVKSSLVLTHESSLSIRKCLISNSGGYGIYVYDRNVTLNADAPTANTFAANALASVFYNQN